VIAHDVAEAVLLVTRDKVNETLTRALATLPVQDLTVENPPLEEVMSELFARSSRRAKKSRLPAAAAGAEAGGA